MHTAHLLEPFLTVAQVATLLAMTESWVYAECQKYTDSRGREGLPCKRFGRAVRVSPTELEKWCATR